MAMSSYWKSSAVTTRVLAGPAVDVPGLGAVLGRVHPAGPPPVSALPDLALPVRPRARRLVLSTELTNSTAQSTYERLGWKRDTVFCQYRLEL